MTSVFKGIFGGGSKKQKAPEAPPPVPLVDPGAPPADPNNASAQALIGQAAIDEQRRLTKKGLASTYINGARGVPNPRAKARTLMAVG